MCKLVSMLLPLLLATAGPAWASAVLFIGSSVCAAPPGCPLFGTEVNAITPTALIITENGAGQPALMDPLLLILGFVNLTSTFALPSITLSAGTGSPGGPDVYPTTTTKWDADGFAGSYTAAFSGTPDSVYNVVGLIDPNGGSESFVNWSAAELAVLGITATSFGIGVYELTGTGITGDGSVTVNFSSPLPVGTFVVAYGCSGTTGIDHHCPPGNTFSTPFTQSGLVTGNGVVVPEPGTLALLGAGLAGLWSWRRPKPSR